MTPPSPSSTRPYTRATASAIAAGKRRAVDSDDEHDAHDYFDASHEDHSPNVSRSGPSRNRDDSHTEASPGDDRAEPEDVDMINVRLTTDDSEEGILEQPSTSSTNDDRGGMSQTVQSESAMDSACGGDCSGGYAYDLRSRNYGRGKENVPPLADEDWHRASDEGRVDGQGRHLSTPGAGPSGTRPDAEGGATESNADVPSRDAITTSPARHGLRRSRTLNHLPSSMEPSSPRVAPPSISISEAGPPALSTRARSTRRPTRGNPATPDDSDAALEDTDREDDAEMTHASGSLDHSRESSVSGPSSTAGSSTSRKRRCIRSSASLQVPISTSSAANQLPASNRPSPSPSASSSSFQVPTLRSATSTASNSSAASSSRRITRTASSPNITRSATFSGSSSTNSQAMYSMSCAANKRRLSNGPNGQASSFGKGLAELAKASSTNSSGGGRPTKNRKREMSVSSVRSEASISGELANQMQLKTPF
jgi:hypothetical protein